ncbi:MAG TPA: hypothetical protein DCL60_13980 [Armatimonadetes bacterium]|nr:hypothetical protein [Armatimonadota bacterium]
MGGVPDDVCEEDASSPSGITGGSTCGIPTGEGPAGIWAACCLPPTKTTIMAANTQTTPKAAGSQRYPKKRCKGCVFEVAASTGLPHKRQNRDSGGSSLPHALHLNSIQPTKTECPSMTF